MTSEPEGGAPRTCAREGCDRPLTGQRRRWCSDECRTAARKERRNAEARQQTALARADKKDRLVAEVAGGVYFLAPAARAVGVDPFTAYRWAAEDPEFGRRLDDARAIASDLHEWALMAAVNVGNPASVRLMESVLRRVDANEARRRAVVEQHARRRREDDARRGAEPPAVPEPDCGAALEWARKPRLEAV